MRDIFEIIKHEDHNIQVVKYDNEYILGCKDCGITLIKGSEILKNVNEYVELMNVLRKRCNVSNLYTSFKNIGIKTMEFTEESSKTIASVIIDILKKREKDNYYGEYDKISTNLNFINYINNYYKDKLGIDDPYQLMTVIFGNFIKDAYDERINLILDEINKMTTNKYSYLRKDEQKVIASRIFKVANYTTNIDDNILIINNEMMQELEKEHPTPTDVYKFKDINDFYDKKPCWDDEEEENAKFYEYMYRMENNLYDFDNIKLLDILKGAIDDYAQYDYVKRNVAVIDMVLEAYGMKIN